MTVNFREVEVSKLSADLVEHLSNNQADVQVKIAALRAAADAIQQSVLIQALAVSIANILTPKS